MGYPLTDAYENLAESTRLSALELGEAAKIVPTTKAEKRYVELCGEAAELSRNLSRVYTTLAAVGARVGDEALGIDPDE